MNVEAAIHSLVDAGVEFVIVGGWSAILNGSAYITNDLDICYARSSQNLGRLAQALAPYHPRLRDLRVCRLFGIKRRCEMAQSSR